MVVCNCKYCGKEIEVPEGINFEGSVRECLKYIESITEEKSRNCQCQLNVRMLDELRNGAAPLIEILENHYDPHCEIVVSTTGVRVIRTEKQDVLMPEPYKFTPEDSNGRHCDSPGCGCTR